MLSLKSQIFRLFVQLFFDHDNYNGLKAEIMSFKPVLDYFDIVTKGNK